MKLKRKNNALTNDVVSMYDAVGYGEVADSMVQQMGSNVPAPSGGGGGGGGGIIAAIIGYIIYKIKN